MTIGMKALITILLLAGTMGVTVPAQGKEGFLGGAISANISMLNDYRFRGLSLNDEGFALQAGLDWSYDSGFYYDFFILL